MEIQWLRGEEVVETDDPNDGHYFISNQMMTVEMAGEYFCRAKRTDNTFTDSSSAGRLTVLG